MEDTSLIRMMSIAFALLLLPIYSIASNLDKGICEALKAQERNMASKLPYRIGEFWLNMQFTVNCVEKAVIIVKKHTVLRANEFEANTAEEFKSQLINSNMCHDLLFQSETGWTFNITLQDVEGAYVTSAQINYKNCRQGVSD